MDRYLWSLALALALPLAAAPPFGLITRTDVPWPGTVQVISADFNGDGIADIAALGDHGIRIFLGTGNHGFRGGATIAVPGGSNSYDTLLSADFNLDGKPDLAVFGGTGFLLINNGDGTFHKSLTFSGTSAPAVTADFNGDGKPDLAIGVKSGFAIYLGKGDGTFEAPLQLSSSNSGCLASGDLNGDGIPDLADCGSVYLGKGNGTFGAAMPFNLPSLADCVAISDLNQDGTGDLVAIKYYENGVPGSLGPVYVLFGRGDGSFDPVLQLHSDIGTLVPTLAIGDVTGDGRPDIVVLGTYGLVGVLANNGEKGFTHGRVYNVAPNSGYPWGSVSLASLSGDGQPDILTSGSFGRFFSVLFHKEGGFRDSQSVAFPNAASPGTAENDTPVAQADFNGDGLQDLAFVASRNGVLSIATVLQTGKQAAPFEAGPRTTIRIGRNELVNGLATADFNNDGKPDLAICFAQIRGANLPGVVRIFLGKGDGTFRAAPGGFDVPLTAFQMLAGDFNGDGNADLALSSGFVALGNGDGTFGTPVRFYNSNANYFAAWIGTADFNGDGKLDLTAQISQSSTVSPPLQIFLGNGDGTFQSPISYTWKGLPTWATVADLNHDGKPDIVTLSYAQGFGDSIAAVFLGNGDGTLQPPQYIKATATEQPNQIIAVDLNGDGNVDLAITDWWQNSIYLFAGNGDGTFGPQTTIGGAVGMGWIGADNLQGQQGSGLPDLFTVDFGPNGLFPPLGSGMAVSIFFNH